MNVLLCFRSAFCIILSFFFMYLPSPNLGLTPPPGTYSPNARGSDAFRGSNCLWTRILDTQARASVNVWSAQCKSLRSRQHRTEHKRHAPNPRTEIKIPDPAGNQTRAAGLEVRDSTDLAMETDILKEVLQSSKNST